MSISESKGLFFGLKSNCLSVIPSAWKQPHHQSQCLLLSFGSLSVSVFGCLLRSLNAFFLLIVSPLVSLSVCQWIQLLWKQSDHQYNVCPSHFGRYMYLSFCHLVSLSDWCLLVSLINFITESKCLFLNDLQSSQAKNTVNKLQSYYFALRGIPVVISNSVWYSRDNV